MEQANCQELPANEDKKKLSSGKRKTESHVKKFLIALACLVAENIER